jgi:hypothetical protein
MVSFRSEWRNIERVQKLYVPILVVSVLFLVPRLLMPILFMPILFVPILFELILFVPILFVLILFNAHTVYYIHLYTMTILLHHVLFSRSA